jgi:threonine/homoserine/homoserine lactone efflux protein
MLFLNFLVGLVVNFTGYVPFGNINLTVVQLTINRGLKQAMYFIVSFSIVEFFFTYAIMYFADWFAGHERLLYWLDWLIILILFVMSVLAWRNESKEKQADYSKKDSVKYGIILGFVNPVQVPFWMVWGTYLLSHDLIDSGNGALAVFSLGSAVGAFLCLFCFARFSKYLHEKFAFSSKIINHSIAVVLFLIALFLLGKMLLQNH